MPKSSWRRRAASGWHRRPDGRGHRISASNLPFLINKCCVFIDFGVFCVLPKLAGDCMRSQSSMWAYIFFVTLERSRHTMLITMKNQVLTSILQSIEKHSLAITIFKHHEAIIAGEPMTIELISNRKSGALGRGGTRLQQLLLKAKDDCCKSCESKRRLLQILGPKGAAAVSEAKDACCKSWGTPPEVAAAASESKKTLAASPGGTPKGCERLQQLLVKAKHVCCKSWGTPRGCSSCL